MISRPSTIPFRNQPAYAAWEHCEARAGFEVAFLSPEVTGGRAEGTTAAVEDDDAWAVHYLIALDAGWATRSAQVCGRSPSGRHELELHADGAGRWRIDGRPAAYLEGCLDVDLESSCLTNAFPANRLGLEIGESADAPAAYVRATHLRVERLEQRYTRLDDVDRRKRYLYRAPRFDFECQLIYDEAGLLLDYPGIGRRVA